MRAFIFPGQGCQKEGMGKDLYEQFPKAKELFERANDYLGRRITDVMFNGTELELMQTINTQPSVFLYEVVLAMCQNDVRPDAVAGHSLGEFAALVVNGCLSFEDGLNLVLNRAIIGQKAYENAPVKTGMGAVIGLSDDYVAKRIKEIWDETGEPIYFANYNGPGQVVISGSKKGVRTACKAFMEEGAKRQCRCLLVVVSILLSWIQHVRNWAKSLRKPNSIPHQSPSISVWMPYRIPTPKRFVPI